MFRKEEGFKRAVSEKGVEMQKWCWKPYPATKVSVGMMYLPTRAEYLMCMLKIFVKRSR